MKFEKLPQHIAIIPDGNRRWAKLKHRPALWGHEKGEKNLEVLIKEIKNLGVSVATVWVFSTENWKRSKEEVRGLDMLITNLLIRLKKQIFIEKTKFVHIGRKDRLSKRMLKVIEELEEATKQYTDFTVCAAIDYGGEDELLRASIEHKESKSQNPLTDFLDTTKKGLPVPDLIIRTSGEHRTSGFMPLQSAYSEWYFAKQLFPDFGIEELHHALKDYEVRERRHGK